MQALYYCCISDDHILAEADSGLHQRVQAMAGGHVQTMGTLRAPKRYQRSHRLCELWPRHVCKA